jgi:uncharacterized protein (TIGR03000 family)
MIRRIRIPEQIALTLIGLALTGGPLFAQVGSSGNPYPYWGSAPSSYGMPDSIVRPPGLSPNYNSQLGFGLSAYGPSYSPYFGTTLPNLDSMNARLDFLARLPGGTHLPPTDSKAYIWLSLPADAEVWFNDDKTKQTGEIRHFYTAELTPHKEYVYVVRVRWMKDGKPVERTRRLTVHARDRIHLDFLEHDAEKSPSTTSAKGSSSSAAAK